MSRTYRNEAAANLSMQARAERNEREARALKAFSMPAPQRTRPSTLRRIARALSI